MAARAKSVGVRELRQNLSIYLARVKKGQSLTVTEHGQAVAELRPLQPADPLQQLVAEGRVVAPGRGSGALPKPLRVKLERPVSALLQDLRDDAI
jgi:prevent-host-death family protein